MKRVPLVMVAALALALAASGSAGATSHPKAKPKPKSAIGTTVIVLNQAKQYEAVKLVAVTDPAAGATPTFDTPPAGDRFVSVTLQLHNRSKGTDVGDANNNTTLVGSNRQVYDAAFTAMAGCTDFSDGQYTLATGTTEIGCVAFAVPSGVTIAKVEYNPNSGFSTNNATVEAEPSGLTAR